MKLLERPPGSGQWLRLHRRPPEAHLQSRHWRVESNPPEIMDQPGQRRRRTPSAPGHYTRSRSAGITSPPWLSPTNSRGYSGPCGRRNDPSRCTIRADSQTDRTRVSQGLHRARSHMAHRSDRRGDPPITRLASRPLNSDWHPARGFHDGPERTAPPERPKIRLQSDPRRD